MTSIQGPARDQYLTALAQVIGSGAAQSPESLEAVAKDVAKDIAAAHNVDATDLFEAAPAQWLKNPSDYGVKTEAQNFLQIAQSVLQVPMATVSPIATRGVQSAKDMNIQIALTRSDAVKNNPRPAEFLEEIDLATVDPRDVMKKIEALAKHPRFADLFGVRTIDQRHGAFFADVARLAGSVVADLQRQGPAPEVRAGGVPVSGPAYEATLTPVISAPLEPKMSLIALTYALTRVKLVLSNLDEVDLRSAVAGKPAMFVSGRVPQDLFALHGVPGRAAVQIALSEPGLAALQQKPPDSLTAAAGRFAELLKDAFYDFDVHAGAWVPYALIYDRNAEKSPAIGARVQAFVDKLAAEAKPA